MTREQLLAEVLAERFGTREQARDEEIRVHAARTERKGERR